MIPHAPLLATLLLAILWIVHMLFENPSRNIPLCVGYVILLAGTRAQIWWETWMEKAYLTKSLNNTGSEQ